MFRICFFQNPTNMKDDKELLDKYNLITDKKYTVEDVEKKPENNKDYFEQQYFEQRYFEEYSAYDKTIQCTSIL